MHGDTDRHTNKHIQIDGLNHHYYHQLTLPALLAGGAEPGSVQFVVDPAGPADVVVAVPALALGVEQEGEGRAAADAAALVEATLP